MTVETKGNGYIQLPNSQQVLIKYSVMKGVPTLTTNWVTSGKSYVLSRFNSPQLHNKNNNSSYFKEVQ